MPLLDLVKNTCVLFAFGCVPTRLKTGATNGKNWRNTVKLLLAVLLD